MAMGHNPKVDAARFSMVPRNDVPRSVFSNRHMHKTTFAEGLLIPCYLAEVLPGDSFRLRMTALTRLASPIVPIMDNLAFESAFFYVPNRIMWSNWEKFMGETATAAETTEYLAPKIVIADADIAPGSLSDYFGIYNNESGNAIDNVVAFPWRAYNLIWNDWFREQSLQDKLGESTGDGPDASGSYSTQYVCVKPDYFTTAKPWPQKPVNQSAIGFGNSPATPGSPWMVNPQAGAPVSGIGVGAANAPTVSATSIDVSGSRVQPVSQYYDTAADTIFFNATSGGNFPDVRVLINDIRTANMVQLMMERDARGGTRYVEKIMSHFGVRPPDARVQRPEYLGGGRTMVSVNPVAQTSASANSAGGNFSSSTRLGQLAAVGFAAAHGHGFSHSFTEHGWIVGVMWCRADLTYQNGIDRMFFRRSQFDYYFPALAHLGEQAILSKEIYATGAAADADVFGYQQRWEEYRWTKSRTSGYFRSGIAAPIDMWHLGVQFGARPVLNATFIAETAPMTRVLQVTAPFSAQLMSDCMFEVTKARAIPMFSVPGMGPRL